MFDLKVTSATYTEAEARALLDKTFESTIDFFRVPQGTRGTVVDVEFIREVTA